MSLSYHFSFAATAGTKPDDLETFLKSVEAEAKVMGYSPTLVLNASFDTQERREFARRLTTGFPVEDERLKEVALPSPGMVWSHDQQHGTARVIPSKAVVLVLTDEYQCETIFGFFKYPEEVADINGQPIAKTDLKNPVDFEGFCGQPRPSIQNHSPPVCRCRLSGIRKRRIRHQSVTVYVAVVEVSVS
jgi:hypothetical protein